MHIAELKRAAEQTVGEEVKCKKRQKYYVFLGIAEL